MEFFANLFWNRVLWETTESPRCFFLHPWRPFVFVYRTVRKTRQVGAPPTSIAFSNFPISLLLTRDPNHAIDASVRMSSLRIPLTIYDLSVKSSWSWALWMGGKMFPRGLAEDIHGKCCCFCLTDGDLYVARWIVFGKSWCALNRAHINSGRKSLARREAFMEQPHPRKGRTSSRKPKRKQDNSEDATSRLQWMPHLRWQILSHGSDVEFMKWS